jgi:hypothetical protein
VTHSLLQWSDASTPVSGSRLRLLGRLLLHLHDQGFYLDRSDEIATLLIRFTRPVLLGTSKNL